ncbi:MAG: hypothetical protein H6Q15_2090 [Bacteroidetes bacterium]|nr:hypothetical protein [Bacteroidota bacterium]
MEQLGENKELVSVEDIAEQVSTNEESADLYFAREGIDIGSYVAKGLRKIDKLINNNKDES